MYQLVSEELKKNANNDTQNKFNQILNSSNKIGLLINERFVNIPSKISHPMLNSLHDEINRMKKKNDSYNFDYYLMISKIWKEKGSNDNKMGFSNEEEEIFHKNCFSSFSFSVANKADTGLTGKWLSEDKELIPFRLVFLFKADKLPYILDGIQQFVLT